MCATCGCSGTIGIESATPAAHDQGHAHEHPHHHDDLHHHEHAHGHGHSHDHLPGQEHSRGVRAMDSTATRTVKLEQEILAKNRLLAERNRGWLEGREVFAVNLMSSPGAGKTALLERTVRALGTEVAVIEGDQETRLDADRIRATGARVLQINTGTGCHLDAQMLGVALHELAPPIGSLLFVENVGNLVCPALFDLGEGARVVIASTTEGEDKPLKYPHMFRAADLIVLNKVDLLAHLEFSVERFTTHVRSVNPSAKVLQVSAIRGDGMPAWYQWLKARDPGRRLTR